MNLPYTGNIPNPPNNPSTDVPDMQTNTNSIESWVTVDHYGFNTGGSTNNFGGLHSQIRMPTLGNVSTPPTLVNGAGNLYVNTVSARSELFYIPDNTGNVYQLTRTSNSSFASFAVANPGWTFLPGGMLFQYGLATSSGTSLPNTTITFPRAYSTGLFSVNATILTTADSRFFVEIYDSSTTQFRAVTRDSGGAKTSGITFYWMAIGV